MKVVKFGGSSLADSRQIEKACEIILADKERRLWWFPHLVSAQKGHKNDRSFN